MKSLRCILLAFGLLFLFCSCEKKTTTPVSETTNTVIQGSWKITLFKEDDDDETNHFSSYTFGFAHSGSVTAVNGSTSGTGTWKAYTDSNQEKFDLNFGPDKPLEELNEDWVILERTPVKLRLQHVSGGHGGTDLLIMEKIK